MRWLQTRSSHCARSVGGIWIQISDRRILAGIRTDPPCEAAPPEPAKKLPVHKHTPLHPPSQASIDGSSMSVPILVLIRICQAMAPNRHQQDVTQKGKEGNDHSASTELGSMGMVQGDRSALSLKKRNSRGLCTHLSIFKTALGQGFWPVGGTFWRFSNHSQLANIHFGKHE